jgi:hypothetical protein
MFRSTGLMRLVVQPGEGLDGRVDHHDSQNKGEKVRRFGLLIPGQKLKAVPDAEKDQRNAGGAKKTP